MPDLQPNASIPLGFNPPQQQNPLATLGTLATTTNALNQNKLFQQQFQARQAIGQAYQQATDPQTGQLDTNKLQSIIANDPRAAFMAGDVAQAALARQKSQLDIQQSQLALANEHVKNLGNIITPLLNKPDLSEKDVISSLGTGVAQGLFTAQNAAQEYLTKPSGPNGGPADPQQLKGWLQGYLLRNMDAVQKANAQYGTPTAISTGGQTNIVSTPQFGGPPQVRGALTNTLTPGENAQRVPTFQGNQPGSVPQSSLVDPTGHAAVTPPNAVGGGSLSTGQVSALNAVNPAQAPTPATPVPAPPGFVPTGPKLGASAAADVTATQSAGQGVDLQKAADQVPQVKATLDNLQADLNNFTSGPGSDWTKVAKAFVNRNVPLPAGMKFDPGSIASQEEFGKQSFQLAQQQFQALGGTGTDSKLDSTMHTSPNEFLSEQGNRGIISLLKGNADAIAAKNQAWQQWHQSGNGSETYGQFSTQFNKSYDPRVFQSVYMTTPEKQNMIKNLNSAEKTQLQQSYNNAVSQGWIPDPRAGNAAR